MTDPRWAHALDGLPVKAILGPPGAPKAIRGEVTGLEGGVTVWVVPDGEETPIRFAWWNVRPA